MRTLFTCALLLAVSGLAATLDAHKRIPMARDEGSLPQPIEMRTPPMMVTGYLAETAADPDGFRIGNRES